MTQEELNIIKYIAEECERQHSGGESVYNMIVAWEFARVYKERLTLDVISTLGTLTEPIDNKRGFRTIRIFVSDGWTSIEKAPWERVPGQLQMLLDSYYEGTLTPSNEKALTSEDQFYFEYENIHPFRDGNGRTGKIIYNFLLGTLSNPFLPPNFWGYTNL
jgi:hypothetical protein